MGRLSRERLKIRKILNSLPAAEQRETKLRLQQDIAYRNQAATAFACRFIKGQVLASEAEVTRARMSVENWSLRA